MSAVLSFPPMRETDSLPDRICAIWNLPRRKPAEIWISLGSAHPDDNSFLEWSRYPFSRTQAAKALRYCRREKMLIEPCQVKKEGDSKYSVSEVGMHDVTHILFHPAQAIKRGIAP